MWSTGARVSSVLYGCRLCDLILAPGREQITFHDTKNGTPVTASLHPWAAEILTEYLEWRGDLHDRESPLFVTPKKCPDTGRHLPYTDNGRAYGGQNKTAFRAMRRRTAETLRAAGRADDAHLVEQVTQHWFRHLLATTLLARSGDMRSVMEQGGWLDPRSVVGYTHDVPARRRSLIAGLDAPNLDTTLTREAGDGRKKA